MASNSNSSGGVSGTTLLQLLFITLKLTRVIDWSWWWVMSPTWIIAIIVLVALAVGLLIEKPWK